MDTLTAIGIIEDQDDATEEELTGAWQHLVDTGEVWTLQGWYGRTAQGLLNAGILRYPEHGSEADKLRLGAL